MTTNLHNTELLSEADVTWEVFQNGDGLVLRTRDGFGKYLNFVTFGLSISNLLRNKVTDANAWRIQAVYHDCNILSVQIEFNNNNEWVR